MRRVQQMTIIAGLALFALSTCGLGGSAGKDACNVPDDCLDGFVCEQQTCVDPNNSRTPDAGTPKDVSSSGEFLVRNRTAHTFSALYIASLDATGSKENLLGATPLQPGENIAISNIGCGVYDVRLVDPYERDCELLAQRVCSDEPVWTVTDAQLAGCMDEVVVQNSSSTVLNELYLATPSDRSWGANLLGGEVLQSTQTRRFSDVNCGVYDVLVVDEQDTHCEVAAANLCPENSVWMYTDATCSSF